MKKLVLLPILALALIFTGCNKLEDEPTPKPNSGEGEVVFKGEALETNQLKDGMDLDRYAEYALITIDGIEYKRDVYYINDIPYTQAIKLAPGTYTVELFLMMDDSLQTPNDLTDDVILYSTPEQGSEFATYVSQTTDFDITVIAFQKLEYQVEVLRFEASQWQEFGFDWFVIEESIIYEHCFFGDLCVKNPADYATSLYQGQANGLQMDMPAIAYIEVWQESTRDDDTDYELTGTFSNESFLGEGAPLCVNYEDYNLYADEYKLKLFILVADGETFSYKHFLTWEFTDATAETVLVSGDDGITDYVLGTCVPDADFMIPPYMNLPATVTYSFNLNPSAPGNEGGYLDATLTNVGSGYEIYDDTYASWCFDHQVTITPGSREMDVYSSLYPNLMPDFLSQENWEKANWIMNHLDWYDGYEWDDIQGAFWLLDDPQWNGNANGGVPALSTMEYAQQMYDDAMQYGNGYVPLPGGWAAVIFVPEGTPPDAENPDIQTVFIVVDP